jgi:hypothetical protein
MVITKSIVIISLFSLIHSWYPEGCCEDKHCHPVPCNELVDNGKGKLVLWQKYQFDKQIIRPSPDDQCHICLIGEQPGCIWIPMPNT